jgi:hypothetical protein
MRDLGAVLDHEQPLPLPPLSQTAFDFDRTHYPRFHDGPSINKFCIPIQADYHRRLFPEISVWSRIAFVSY